MQEEPHYAGTWVVMPTYNEIENLPTIVPAILEALPGAKLLIVDDNSPDGTGKLADEMAAANESIEVMHRAEKQGLGRAYIDGYRRVLDAGAQTIVQMDADWSHDPKYLRQLVGNLDKYDLVIGSRYVKGGGVRNWGITRKLVSRGGSTFARTVLWLRQHDLTGAFKAWRRPMLEAVPFDTANGGGYVFQIETTYRAQRAGARIKEIPIIFVDRALGKSKMSRAIFFEAFRVVLRLRWDELRGRLRRSS